MNARLQAAIRFAVNKHVHEMRQVYGDVLPFSHHLEHVWRNVQRFSAELFVAGFSYEDLQSLECAAWLHDTLEDCNGVTLAMLEAEFGVDVARLVWLVTDEPFPMVEPRPSRKERHALTYAKLKGYSMGVYLKLCDRIANVEFGGEPMKMYRSEYEGFKVAVRTPGQWEVLWNHLELALLVGDREGVLLQQNKPQHVRRTD